MQPTKRYPEIPENMRNPKQSDSSHNFANYGMTEEQLDAYLRRREQERRAVA